MSNTSTNIFPVLAKAAAALLNVHFAHVSRRRSGQPVEFGQPLFVIGQPAINSIA
jgi:hypothetical protein